MLNPSVFDELAAFGTFLPEEASILYHYCSTETFLSIITSKSIRFSDINTMNDYGEMHWAYDRFVEAINLDLDKYDRKCLDALDQIISTLQLTSLPLISCLSKDGDVLSQWRAYADDGAGIALGFDAVQILRLSAKVGHVVYKRSEQVNYFKRLLSIAHEFWPKVEEGESFRLKFQKFFFSLSFDLCLMKNPAFSEEQEVRLIRVASVERTPSKLVTLKDSGGAGKDKLSTKKLPIRYRSRKGGVVAFVDMPIGGLGPEAIKDIVIGPRSPNNGNEISMALTTQGFKGFNIRQSTATYR